MGIGAMLRTRMFTFFLWMNIFRFCRREFFADGWSRRAAAIPPTVCFLNINVTEWLFGFFFLKLMTVYCYIGNGEWVDRTHELLLIFKEFKSWKIIFNKFQKCMYHRSLNKITIPACKRTMSSNPRAYNARDLVHGEGCTAAQRTRSLCGPRDEKKKKKTRCALPRFTSRSPFQQHHLLLDSVCTGPVQPLFMHL